MTLRPLPTYYRIPPEFRVQPSSSCLGSPRPCNFLVLTAPVASNKRDVLFERRFLGPRFSADIKFPDKPNHRDVTFVQRREDRPKEAQARRAEWRRLVQVR